MGMLLRCLLCKFLEAELLDFFSSGCTIRKKAWCKNEFQKVGWKPFYIMSNPIDGTLESIIFFSFWDRLLINTIGAYFNLMFS
uniref:Putative ovule protein n=1 Tax=Solanum chacoense TaxID=4108 RepID=A0A0V0GVJ7_SOLCH